MWIMTRNRKLMIQIFARERDLSRGFTILRASLFIRIEMASAIVP